MKIEVIFLIQIIMISLSGCYSTIKLPISPILKTDANKSPFTDIKKKEKVESKVSVTRPVINLSKISRIEIQGPDEIKKGEPVILEATCYEENSKLIEAGYCLNWSVDAEGVKFESIEGPKIKIFIPLSITINVLNVKAKCNEIEKIFSLNVIK
jgi:hypothetical protein